MNKYNNKVTLFDMELNNNFYSISYISSNGEMFPLDDLDVSCP